MTDLLSSQLLSFLVEQNVTVHYGHLDCPKEQLLPPFYGFPGKLVGSAQVIRSVDCPHVCRIINCHCWLRHVSSLTST